MARISAHPDGPFRTPQATGSEPRLSETGEGSADPAKKGGNEESREGRSRLGGVNPLVDGFTGKNPKLPRRNTLRYAARGEIGSANAGWLHWKEVNEALPDGLGRETLPDTSARKSPGDNSMAAKGE